MHLKTSRLTLSLNEQTGAVTSLRIASDPDFEFAGTSENTRYPSWERDAPWLGDILMRVWNGVTWTALRTWQAPASVSETDGRIDIDNGSIEGISLQQSWSTADDAIIWTITVANKNNTPAEIGELAAAFVLNTDYESVFRGEEDKAKRSIGELQRHWHEERLQQHLHVSGGGSYALYQHPSGLGPALFIGPLGDAAWEAAYQIDPEIGNQWSNTFEGPYFVAPFTRAARIEGRWLQNRQRQNVSMHGNSSLVLAPGETRSFAFQIAALDDLGDVGTQLARNGQLAIEALPAPAVPVGETVRLLVSGSSGAITIRPENGNTPIIEQQPLANGTRSYLVSMTEPGEKSLLIEYGDGRWTRVFLYATSVPRDAFKARAKFIVAHQQFHNPDDPFGRDGAFMPYDNDRECIYLHSEEAWQTGASDEYGVVVGMVLAEKNVHMPDPGEVAVVDDYIDRFLLKRLQDPVTLGIRRGMYFWPERPSGIGHEWTEAVASEITRYNNYPLVANVYYSMFRIAEAYGIGKRSTADYLSLCWRTLVKGFEVGITRLAGAPAGAFQFEVLEALRTRDPGGHAALGHWLKVYSDYVRADAYPYGSELYIDQTAHAQVFAAVERDGSDAEIDKTLRVTRAMRAGYQPSWFRYGNDERGSVCCWYGTPQNSAVLQRGFELRGDLDLLALASGGLTSFLTTLRSTGTVTGWFTWWPDRIGFDPRTLDTDLGLYNYLRAAKAFVVDHPRAGRVGFSCRLTDTTEGTEVRPWDGVHKRLWLDRERLEITVTDGAIDKAVIAIGGSVAISLASVSPKGARVALSVRDLDGGRVVIDVGDESVMADGVATLERPAASLHLVIRRG